MDRSEALPTSSKSPLHTQSAFIGATLSHDPAAALTLAASAEDRTWHARHSIVFHYKPDSWRASKVRNIGVIEGNQSVSDNERESITSGGDRAIANWIAGQMHGKSCVIVLLGAQTAGRKWINHEIIKGWCPFTGCEP